MLESATSTFFAEKQSVCYTQLFMLISQIFGKQARYANKLPLT